jgi:hypothetical protein
MNHVKTSVNADNIGPWLAFGGSKGFVGWTKGINGMFITP